jgi:3-oxoacyl-[acyl-carrier protein] reductase
MKDLSGKRALVTGAGSGIGRAIALALAKEGARLFLLDLDASSATAAANAASARGVEAIARQCDIADAAQVDAACQALLAAWDGIDILVNNAGIVYYGNAHAMSAQQWERVLAVNLLGPIRFIHNLLPALRRSDESQILNVSSIMGLVPKRRTAAYQASKFGLVGLSLSLRAEYSPSGVGVSVLCPGLVDTQLLPSAGAAGMLDKKPKIKSWWLVSPRYIAKHAVRAIKTNPPIVVVPWGARVFWWMQRYAPWLMDWHNHWMHGRDAREKRLREANAAASSQTSAPDGSGASGEASSTKARSTAANGPAPSAS